MAPKHEKAAASDKKGRSTKPSTSPEQNKKAEESGSGSEDSSDSGSENGGSSSSSDSDESQSESKTPSNKADETTNQQPKKEQSSKSNFRAPEPYKPPPGFKPIKKQSAPSSTTSSLLSDLRGKQVYHITAPSFLPLDKVNEIALSDVMKGAPVLEHNGVQYGIPPDAISQAEAGDKALALYDPKTQAYYSTPANTIQSYHIQELVNLPQRSPENDVALESAREQVKPPRKQPKNLKMRFRPVGSGDAPAETIGSSEEESEGEKPTVKESSKDKDAKKRKKHQAEEEASQAAAEPRKKSKKHSAGEKEDKPHKSSKNREEKKAKKSKKAA